MGVEHVRCIGINAHGQLHKCRHYVQQLIIVRFVRRVNGNTRDKINLRLDLNNKTPLEKDTEPFDFKRNSFRNRTESYIRVQMPDELPETQLSEHKIDRRLSKMRYLKTCIKTETIQQLNNVIIEHISEVRRLIETNIHVIKPNSTERNIYLNLVRFIELKTILGCSDREIQHDYGQKENLVTVLSLARTL